MMVLLAFLMSAPASAKNPDLSSLPPKVLFHYGQKKHMLDNEKNGISDEVWQKNIMGQDTRFGLLPWRRGLYGGSNFESLDHYGNGYLAPDQRGKIPWMMKITLKDECLQPENVTDLATDQNFLKALIANASYLAQYADICLNLKTKDCRDLVTGYQPTFAQEEYPCDEIMQKVIIDSKAKVVRDIEWDSSWYLRDRSCIEKLEASPASTLESLAQGEWTMASRKGATVASFGWGLSPFLMLLDVLSEKDPANPAQLATLRGKLAASDLKVSRSPKSGPEGYGELQWIREAGPASIDAYERCAKNGRQDEFVKLANGFQADLRREFALSKRPADDDEELAALEKTAVFFGAALQAACRP